MEDSTLGGLRRLPEFRKARDHLWQSDGSLQWFVRENRAELVASGALVMLNGRWHANEPKFDSFVLEAGQRAAQKHTTQTREAA